jgi:hypothetical protein
MKKSFLVFVALVGLTISGSAQSSVENNSASMDSYDVISVQDIQTGEMMVARVNAGTFTEGQTVKYRLYGPGQSHWGSAKFVEIFSVEDPTAIGEEMQLARTGFKASHITFGGGTTRVD